MSVKQSSLIILYYVSIHNLAYHKKKKKKNGLRWKSVFCLFENFDGIAAVQQQHAVYCCCSFGFIKKWIFPTNQSAKFLFESFFSWDRWLNTAVSFDMYTQREKVAGASLSRRQTIPDVNTFSFTFPPFIFSTGYIKSEFSSTLKWLTLLHITSSKKLAAVKKNVWRQQQQQQRRI